MAHAHALSWPSLYTTKAERHEGQKRKTARALELMSSVVVSPAPSVRVRVRVRVRIRDGVRVRIRVGVGVRVRVRDRVRCSRHVRMGKVACTSPSPYP